MRSNFSISSQEIEDRFKLAQESMIYLLGYNESGVIVSGLYDYLESSGVAMYTNPSGIPHLDDELPVHPLLVAGQAGHYKAGIYTNIPKRWR